MEGLITSTYVHHESINNHIRMYRYVVNYRRLISVKFIMHCAGSLNHGILTDRTMADHWKDNRGARSQ